MKSAKSTKTALVLVDVQNGFLHPTHWGPPPRSNPSCEGNIEKLLTAARKHNSSSSSSFSVDIIHIHHHSLQPSSLLYPGCKLSVSGQELDAISPQPFAAPEKDEVLMNKNVNSSFIGTDLEATLRKRGIEQLVICGLTTDHCVSTTTRMAGNLMVVPSEGGVVLVGDATATWGKEGKDGKGGTKLWDAETVQAVNLASLDGEFADVEGTEDVLKRVFGEEE